MGETAFFKAQREMFVEAHPKKEGQQRKSSEPAPLAFYDRVRKIMCASFDEFPENPSFPDRSVLLEDGKEGRLAAYLIPVYLD